MAARRSKNFEEFGAQGAQVRSLLALDDALKEEEVALDLERKEQKARDDAQKRREWAGQVGSEFKRFGGESAKFVGGVGLGVGNVATLGLAGKVVDKLPEKDSMYLELGRSSELGSRDDEQADVNRIKSLSRRVFQIF